MIKDENYFRTEGLAVGYGDEPLIRDIQLNIGRGRIMTVIGPNGAGKTTILRSIIRQLKPLAGVVTLGGADLAAAGRNELARQMAAVMTDRVRPELMTCGEFVAAGRYPYTGLSGRLSDRDRRIVNETMQLVHVEELAGCEYRQISDGQRQRVVLARAICQEPDVLVLDEPTSYLDIRYKLEFLSILQELSRSRGLTVIMSLHELDLAGRISDLIACVSGDHVDRFGTPEEIFTPGYISELYSISMGSFDELAGSSELEAVPGRPQVFVIAGSGMGTQVFRRLQRSGVPFATGIVWENDLDYPAAKALAAEVVSAEPFSEAGAGAAERARKLIDESSSVICALDTEKLPQSGRILHELREYAALQGKLAT